jgi:hypothetical protein
VFNREQAMALVSDDDPYLRALKPVTGVPFGDLCRWKFLPGYYCEGHVEFTCICRMDKFPDPDCSTVWHASCPHGCVNNRCQDPFETCADGWMDDPRCTDLYTNWDDIQQCQNLFGMEGICHLRERQGSIHFATSKSRIREEAYKTLLYTGQAERSYRHVIANVDPTQTADYEVMIDGYMKRTEVSFACERTYPRCRDNHWEGYPCEALRQRHQDNLQELELACRRQFGDQCNNHTVLPKTVCSRSAGATYEGGGEHLLLVLLIILILIL